MMEISEDDDSLTNRQKDTIKDNNDLELPSKETRFNLDINLNERIDISETKSDQESEAKQIETKVEDTFAFDENIESESFKPIEGVAEVVSTTEEMDMFKKNEWADFTDLNKNDQENALKIVSNTDPWTSHFEPSTNQNTDQITDDNWANFEN